MTKQEHERFERAAAAYFARRIGREQFVRETMPRWRAVARRLWEGWRRKLPAWVEREDVEQELVMLALRYARNYDPARGGTPGQFVVWVAQRRAARLLEHWRGASTHGKATENPSRAEVAFSRAFPAQGDGEGQRRSPEEMLRALATQDYAVEQGEEFAEALDGAQSVREALVLLALRRAEGSPRRAAAVLYADFAARVECELEDEEHARRVVGESVSRIAARAGGGGPLLPPEDLFADDEEHGDHEDQERAESAA